MGEVQLASDERPRPNFFIVGAPKCGTTSLHAYLGQHPEVFTSIHKQPHFFDTDVNMLDSVRVGGRKDDLDAYLALYADAKPEHKAIGEGSVWYLYSERAPEAIKAFNPDSRIIIMLRNPVDFMYSNHGERVRWLNEDILDFEQALAAEPDRAAGQRIPPGCTKPCGLLYRETARFSEHVKRYLDAFGPDRVMILLFDDFVNDTAGVYKKTLRFLGVDEAHSADFTPANAGKDYPRFYRLKQRVAMLPGGKLLLGAWWRAKVAMKMLLPGRLFYATRDVLLRWDKTKKRGPMSSELRAELQEEFRPEIERLGKVIGRDLSHWYLKDVPAVQSAGGYATASPAGAG